MEVVTMKILKEIFEEFLKKLKEDETVPNIIIEELKTLWNDEEFISQERLFDIIKNGIADVSED